MFLKSRDLPSYYFFKGFLQIYPITIVFILINSLAYIVFDYTSLPALFLGGFTIVFFWQSVKLVPFIKHYRFVHLTVVLFLLIFQGLLILYLAKQNVDLDYGIFITNLAAIFSESGAKVIFGSIGSFECFYLVLIVSVGVLLEKKYQFFTHRVKKEYNNLNYFIFSFALWLSLIFSPFAVSENFLGFSRSIINYYYDAPFIEIDADEQFPYIHKNELSGKFSSSARKPDIIFVMLESFNESFINKVENGKEVTPFFNKLIDSGVYVENFYANSVLTSKGQFAILSGILPSTKGKFFTEGFMNLNLRSLPNILSENGYYNIFLKAHQNINFDYTYDSMKMLGFDMVESIGEIYKTSTPKKAYWNWGIQDDWFYKNSFDRLEGLVDDKPQFVVMHTVTHHIPFRIPENEKFIYPEAQTQLETFANSMYLADKYLKTFFEELSKSERYKDAIIIISGDHSFHSGRREGLAWGNVNHAYEEYFRTPFLILGPTEIISPKKIKTRHSQVDIAPTILDILAFKTDVNFMGESIFLEQRDRPVHLIQPYSGKYLSVIDKDNYKYIMHFSSSNEFLFNLSSDPNEEENLFQLDKYQPRIEKSRLEIQKILLNQKLVDENRIYKKPEIKLASTHERTVKVKVTTSSVPPKNILEPIIGRSKTYDFVLDKLDIHKRLDSLEKNNLQDNLFINVNTSFLVKKSGSYRFTILSDDAHILTINDELVHMTDRWDGNSRHAVNLKLEEGAYELKIRHFQSGGDMQLTLYYSYNEDGSYNHVGVNSEFIEFVPIDK